MKATRLLPVVESPAVLRHVLGSFRKECSQTVIAVCDLLLVVVALIDLFGRRDE